MEAVLSAGGSVVDLMCCAAGLEGFAAGPEPATDLGPGNWGISPSGEPPPLGQLVVELDSRFFGEVVQTVSAFSDLFPDGRRKLLEVPSPLPPHSKHRLDLVV